jgi:hypothetical protein
MSQFSKVTIDEARAAKESLKEKFAQDFAQAASPVTGVGITRISTAEWGVKVNLDHEPSVEEKNKLPDTHMGVKVRYEVTGHPMKRSP